MTARTQITATNILAISRDTWQSPPAAVAAAAAGMYIQGNGTSPPTALQDFRKFVLFVVIGTTATVVTLRGTGSGNNVAGNAQTSPYPSNAVYTQGSQGDLVSASTTSATLEVGPFTTDRFLQPDGNIYVDFSQVTGVTVYAYQLPYNAV